MLAIVYDKFMLIYCTFHNNRDTCNFREKGRGKGSRGTPGEFVVPAEKKGKEAGPEEFVAPAK